MAERFGVDFDEKYCFETFVTGEWNRLAHSAGRTVAQDPGNAYNPLFVHGPSGFGKTHLLKAIGRAAIGSGKSVVYATSERILNEFVACVFARKMGDFREKYRRCDVLVIDDVQFWAPEHEKTQMEIFHVFNALHSAGKQVVLAADLPPADLMGLESRLRSRFDWGLTVDIQPPTATQRVALVKAKAESAGLGLGEDVIHLLAEGCKGTVRQIEGTIHTLAARKRFEGVEITIDVARNAIPRLTRVVSPAEYSKAILKDTATAFGILPSDILGRNRKRSIVQARQVVTYLSRKFTRMSLAEIGKLIGGRDHTTVLHSIKQVEQGVGADGDLRAIVEKLERKLA